MIKETLLSLLFITCGCTPALKSASENESSVSSIDLTLPSLSSFSAEQKSLLTGYQLIISPFGPPDQEVGCKEPRSVNEIASFSTTNFPNHVITRGCNYRIVMRLGTLDEKANSIKSIYFSNFSRGNSGKTLMANTFLDQQKVSLVLNLGVTQLGVDAKFPVDTSSVIFDPGDNAEPKNLPNDQNPREIKINITGEDGGYSPSSFSVKTGENVLLVVTRTEQGGCGEILKLPDGQQIKLAVGETKRIKFKGDKNGEYQFTCGMGMYRGKIVVQ